MNLIIIIACVVIIVLAFILSPRAEGMRRQIRAYHSCNPINCDKRIVTKEHLYRRNPFLWPFSGTETPEIIIYNDPETAKKVNVYGSKAVNKESLRVTPDTVSAIMAKKPVLESEPDHEPPSL